MRVLYVVDDDSGSRKALVRYLETRFPKLVVASFSSAEDCLECTPPDLLITDLTLGGWGKDGTELIQELARVSRETHFIVVSGWMELDEAKEKIRKKVGVSKNRFSAHSRLDGLDELVKKMLFHLAR